MLEFIKPLLARYLPVVGRYAATAIVGLLAASLNHLQIALPADAAAGLTTGLAGLFVALLGYALNHTKKQAAAADNSAGLANAVRASAASGHEVAMEDPTTGAIHFISARKAPAGLAAGPRQ